MMSCKFGLFFTPLPSVTHLCLGLMPCCHKIPYTPPPFCMTSFMNDPLAITAFHLQHKKVKTLPSIFNFFPHSAFPGMSSHSLGDQTFKFKHLFLNFLKCLNLGLRIPTYFKWKLLDYSLICLPIGKGQSFYLDYVLTVARIKFDKTG